MSAREQMQRQRDESERLLEWNRAATIRQLQADFEKLTPEEQWDLMNEEFFDPAIFREIQQETEA